MEEAHCVQKAGSHSASLLASLNIQREQAQFCDCVVRWRQNPGQLYPAHRCVLAASSPVLAAILSSAGALVELQAPCLSDHVLALLLDYIYTGALPNTCTQQQHFNLLTAARHLQMDELQEALRTGVKNVDNTSATGDENQPYEDINDTYSKSVHTFSKCLPLSDSCSVDSLEREDQCCDEIDTWRSSWKNGASPLSNVGTGSSVNADYYRQVTYLMPRDLIQNIPHTTKEHRVTRVDKEVQKDHFHSAGTVNPESWQMCTEEEQARTVQNRRSSYSLCTAEEQEEQTSGAEKMQRLCSTVKRKAEEKQTNRQEEDNIHRSPLLHLSTSHLKNNVSPSLCSSSSSPSSSPSPSSTHQCCGAVPVIRHSSTTTMVEASTMPVYHPVSQASVSSNFPDSRSGSTDNNRIVEDITTTHKNDDGAQNQDYRNNRDHTETQNWDYKDSSDQCAMQELCYKSNAGQSDILKQDYNSSNTAHDEHMGNGLPHIADDNDHHAHSDSFQKNHTKYCGADSVPLNEDCSSFTRILMCKTDCSFDEFPSKHKRPDCSDCHNVSMATAADERSIHSKDLSAVVPLPVQESDTGSDSHCEDLSLEGEAKEEHNYSSRCHVQMDGQDSHCDPCGLKNDWYLNLPKDERGTKDAASSQHERDNKDAAVDNVTGCTSLQHENIPGTEVSEPHPSFTTLMDTDISDPANNVVGQSYRGHLSYHCLPQKDTKVSHRDSDHNHSHPSHPDHSDLSNDEEEVGNAATPDLSPLRQHFATTDQILLLDISAKPAELLVSYRHRSDEQEKLLAFGQRGTFGNGLGEKDREHRNDATSVAGIGKRKIVREQTRPGPEVIHKAGAAVGENQTATLAVCPPPRVPGSVQTPVSSSLSVCMPSTLSVSMPANISAPLSTPVHPFQCSLCDRSFSQRGSLNRHVRSHLGVRPFPCPRCPMTFSRQYRVSEHMRVHQRCVLGSDFQKPPASSI